VPAIRTLRGPGVYQRIQVLLCSQGI